MTRRPAGHAPTVRGLALPLAIYRQRRACAAALVTKAYGASLPLLFIGCDERRLRAERQDPWFDYYCGCAEPDAALLIDPNHAPRDTLFLDPGDAKRELWDGPRLGPDHRARAAHGIQAVAALVDLDRRVEAAAARAGHRLAMCTRTSEPGAQAAAYAFWKKRLNGVELVNAEPQLVHQRMYKDPAEIALVRKAIAITRNGLLRVLPRIPELRSEAAVAAELVMHYRRVANGPLAFPPIVGSATNGATLHYLHNDQPLVRRAPLLIDSGATAGGYCADVTRTVPQHGRFDDRRFRELYELVLRCNELGRHHLRPGITRAELSAIAWQPITAAGFAAPYNLTHHLGLDVHDPADYSAPYQPGMIVTIEPGIYLPAQGFGIRIEDDLLITRDGCEELTRDIPKTIPAVEAAMRA